MSFMSFWRFPLALEYRFRVGESIKNLSGSSEPISQVLRRVQAFTDLYRALPE